MITYNLLTLSTRVTIIQKKNPHVFTCEGTISFQQTNSSSLDLVSSSTGQHTGSNDLTGSSKYPFQFNHERSVNLHETYNKSHLSFTRAVKPLGLTFIQ